VSPQPGVPVVKKHRYSGFVDTELDLVLRSSDIASLIMTGIATSGCVEATARDGFMRDYYVVLVEDCCGSYSSVLHEGTLQNISEAYGIVAQSDAIMSEWERAGRGVGR
jgi:ureidoacrylate peracid hydrolase